MAVQVRDLLPTDEHDKQLITTKDKPDGGIDSREILRIIKEVIKGNS